MHGFIATHHDNIVIGMNNEDNVYKANSNSPAFQAEIRADVEKNLEKFKDPLVIGELLYKLLEERENTNRILKNILAKLESMGDAKTGQTLSPKDVLLPEIDEEMLKFVRASGKASAEDVKQRFNYKGSNAASARLNRLFELNLLEKKQVGKKVFFFPR